MKVYKSVLILFVVGLVASCSTSSVMSSWSVENPPEHVLDKMLIISVMPTKKMQDEIEQEMVELLEEHNINVRAATELLDPERLKGVEKKEVVEKLQGAGYTSVMLVTVLDKKEENRYVQGVGYYPTTMDAGYWDFYARYHMINKTIYTPGYFTTDTKYVLQAEIFAINEKEDELIYSAKTKTDDPYCEYDVSKAFSRSIVEEMRRKGLLN